MPDQHSVHLMTHVKHISSDVNHIFNGCKLFRIVVELIMFKLKLKLTFFIKISYYIQTTPAHKNVSRAQSKYDHQ